MSLSHEPWRGAREAGRGPRMITYQHNWPWFLVLWGLEGKGCHISLYPCLHSPSGSHLGWRHSHLPLRGRSGIAVSTPPSRVLVQDRNMTLYSRGSSGWGAHASPSRLCFRMGVSALPLCVFALEKMGCCLPSCPSLLCPTPRPESGLHHGAAGVAAPGLPQRRPP